MLFTDPIFLFIFLPSLLALYFILPFKFKNGCLLAFSLLFYAWGESVYILVMLASIAFNFLMGLCIDKAVDGQCGTKRKGLLLLGIGGNLALLVYFKYAVLLFSSLGISTLANIDTSAIHLPIGISFFTFQAITYLVDLYRREIEVQKNIKDLALYICLFPQLIAGPIVRYATVAKALTSRVSTIDDIHYGVRRFIIGLAKKMLIANPMGYLADQIFILNNNEITTPLAWIGITAYTLQIFFDFSAYSDMAIGLGRIFGFHFPENFNYPYIAKSITEFWRRWHMSLSSWFRDYLYIPLGGNRAGQVRTYFNLFIVFALCGFWHGASWTFLAWGIYHGIFLIIERMGLGKLLEKLPHAVRHAYLLLIIMIGWVPFRAETFSQAQTFLMNMFSFNWPDDSLFPPARFIDNELLVIYIIGLIFCTPIHLVIKSAKQRLPTIKQWQQNVLNIISLCSLLALYVLSLMAISADSYNPFIYFRF